jgi:hypothetical protein
MPGGFSLELDTAESARLRHAAWRADPDGNDGRLMSPIEESRRTGPPAQSPDPWKQSGGKADGQAGLGPAGVALNVSGG